MKKLKALFMSLMAMVTMSGAMLIPATVSAATAKDSVCEGLQFTSNTTGCDTTTSESTVKKVVNLGIRLFQMIIGIIAVFMIITAGLTYITSAGDSAKTKSAKDRILYSAIGLMVVVLAEIIVRFVLNRVDSVTK